MFMRELHMENCDGRIINKIVVEEQKDLYRVRVESIKQSFQVDL